MTELRQRASVSVHAAALDGSRSWDWRHLFAQSGPESALRAIAGWLDPDGGSEFVLEFAEGPVPEADSRPVLGEPPWSLTVRGPDGESRSADLAAQAADALHAWRAARVEVDAVGRRLKARTREMQALHEIGRRAAHARDPESLFRAAVDVLARYLEPDAVCVAVREGDDNHVTGYLSRPFGHGELQWLARETAATLEGGARAPVCWTEQPLEDFDDRAGPRQILSDEDVLRFPIARRARIIAAVTVVPSGRIDEALRRLLFAVANQLMLHLERILAVREAEAGRFRAILDSMPQAVLLTDRDLTVLQANRAASGLASLPDTSPGARLPARLGGLELATLAAEALDSESTITSETRTPDDRTWSVTTAAAGGSDRQPGAVVWVLADVTDSRRLQDQLAQSDKMSSLGRMISGVAHELNNPLASIVGYAQLVCSASDDERLVRRLRILHEQAERCRRIVKNLLSFARTRPPERRRLSLNEVTGTVLSLLAYQLKVDGVRVRTELDRSLPSVAGDEHQLQQVLVNLLTNAQQALAAEGGGTVAVRTRQDEGEWVVLEVEDDGQGVPEAVRSRIFDPFFTTKEPGRGTGLGLSLVYGIVASHGGTIELVAERDRGACFRVRLPRGTSVPEPERGPLEASGPAGPPPAPGRVLVVEDEPRIAELLREALAGDGHDVQIAGDGRSALDRLQDEPFDLIVSDLKMPQMDGRKLLEELLNRRPELARRMLVITGDTVGGDSARLAEEAGVAVLAKPFDLDELRRAVQRGLAGGDAGGDDG